MLLWVGVVRVLLKGLLGSFYLDLFYANFMGSLFERSTWPSLLLFRIFASVILSLRDHTTGAHGRGFQASVAFFSFKITALQVRK